MVLFFGLAVSVAPLLANFSAHALGIDTFSNSDQSYCIRSIVVPFILIWSTVTDILVKAKQGKIPGRL